MSAENLLTIPCCYSVARRCLNLGPEAYEGRARVVNAFLEYFSRGGYQSGSHLVNARLRVMERELNLSDIAGLNA